MELHSLPKTTTRRQKRLGLGYGSGKGGHTAGRGQKGQKARSKVNLFFEGAKFRKSLVRRLPLLRGKGKLRAGARPIIVNVKYLNLLPKNSTVDIKSLVKKQIVDEKEAAKFGVKILGAGKLGVALKVALPCSKGAVEIIKKAGGDVVKQKISQKKTSQKTKKEKKRTVSSSKTSAEKKNGKASKKIKETKKETKDVKKSKK